MNKILKIIEKKLKQKETELKTVSRTLMQSKQEFARTRSEMETLNTELIQTNKAISVLAKNIATQKDEMEKRISATICDKIMPIISMLETEPVIKKFRPQINSMVKNLNSMANHDKSYHNAIYLLSEAEMKIATMIKNDMTNKEIASLMNISLETVKTHRKHIRKKLNISNKKYKLSSYLVSLLGNDF